MREIDEIYEGLLADFAARAGFTPTASCDLSVRLYAVAAQLQALEAQSDWVLGQSFPQTAQGNYLEAHAALRGITRTPASCAAGTLRFYVNSAPTSALTVPKGSVCMSAENERFETSAATTVAAGALFGEAPAVALTAGENGNARADTVTLMAALPAGIVRCTNPTAFSGGSEQEDDAALRARLLESFRRLPNGANAAFYEQEALAFAEVAAAKCHPRARGIGTVDVYVATMAGLPGATLLAEIQALLQKKREIAVDVQVKAPTVLTVPVTATLTLREGAVFAEVKAEAERALGNYFTGKLLAKPVLLADLSKLLYAVAGVANYHIIAPAADLDANATVLPRLGSVTLTEA